jgi:Amt family ammonium transporter
MAEDAAAMEFQESFDTAFEGAAVDINAFFVIMSAIFVFLMQAGFCMLAAGSVRARNARGIILKNLMDACMAAIMYYTLGWGLAGLLEVEGNNFIGTSQYALGGIDPSSMYLWFFQYAFAAAACTIVSGALAERATFVAYLGYSVFIIGFVYPIVTHWIWSTSGWASAFRAERSDGTYQSLLFGSGAIDFAGSGAVHMTGGVAAMAGAWVLGPRMGRYDANGKPVPIPGHNVALAILGTFILWFGWYGFNPGSALLILGGASSIVARVCVTTTLSAAAGGLMTLFTSVAIEYKKSGNMVWDVMMAANGALAGLVSITAPCATVTPWAAIIIGCIGAWVFLGGSYLNAYILKIDDPVDAIAVHMWAGMWGVLATGLFSTEEYVAGAYGTVPGTEDGVRYYGGFWGGGGRLFAAQIVYMLAILAWVGGLMGIFFTALKFAGVLRVSPEVEAAGVDASHYGGTAYHGLEEAGLAPPVAKGAPAKDTSSASSDAEELEKLRGEVAELAAKVDALSGTAAV